MNNTKFYYQLCNIDELTNMVSKFIKSNNEFRDTSILNLFEVSQKWKWDNKLNIIVEFANEKPLFSLEWGFPDGQRIGERKILLLLEANNDKYSFGKFAYKVDLSKSIDETILKPILRTLGFNLRKDDRVEGKKGFLMTWVKETFDGEKREYWLHSDSYIFERTDEFRKVDVEWLEDFAWVIKKLDIELQPYKSSIV